MANISVAYVDDVYKRKYNSEHGPAYYEPRKRARLEHERSISVRAQHYPPVSQQSTRGRTIADAIIIDEDDQIDHVYRHELSNRESPALHLAAPCLGVKVEVDTDQASPVLLKSGSKQDKVLEKHHSFPRAGPLSRTAAEAVQSTKQPKTHALSGYSIAEGWKKICNGIGLAMTGSSHAHDSPKPDTDRSLTAAVEQQRSTPFVQPKLKGPFLQDDSDDEDAEPGHAGVMPKQSSTTTSSELCTASVKHTDVVEAQNKPSSTILQSPSSFQVASKASVLSTVRSASPGSSKISLPVKAQTSVLRKIAAPHADASHNPILLHPRTTKDTMSVASHDMPPTLNLTNIIQAKVKHDNKQHTKAMSAGTTNCDQAETHSAGSGSTDPWPSLETISNINGYTATATESVNGLVPRKSAQEPPSSTYRRPTQVSQESTRQHTEIDKDNVSRSTSVCQDRSYASKTAHCVRTAASTSLASSAYNSMLQRPKHAISARKKATQPLDLKIDPRGRPGQAPTTAVAGASGADCDTSERNRNAHEMSPITPATLSRQVSASTKVSSAGREPFPKSTTPVTTFKSATTSAHKSPQASAQPTTISAHKPTEAPFQSATLPVLKTARADEPTNTFELLKQQRIQEKLARNQRNRTQSETSDIDKEARYYGASAIQDDIEEPSSPDLRQGRPSVATFIPGAHASTAARKATDLLAPLEPIALNSPAGVQAVRSHQHSRAPLDGDTDRERRILPISRHDLRQVQIWIEGANTAQFEATERERQGYQRKHVTIRKRSSKLARILKEAKISPQLVQATMDSNDDDAELQLNKEVAIHLGLLADELEHAMTIEDVSRIYREHRKVAYDRKQDRKQNRPQYYDDRSPLQHMTMNDRPLGTPIGASPLEDDILADLTEHHPTTSGKRPTYELCATIEQLREHIALEQLEEEREAADREGSPDPEGYVHYVYQVQRRECSTEESQDAGTEITDAEWFDVEGQSFLSPAQANAAASGVLFMSTGEDPIVRAEDSATIDKEQQENGLVAYQYSSSRGVVQTQIDRRMTLWSERIAVSSKTGFVPRTLYHVKQCITTYHEPWEQMTIDGDDLFGEADTKQCEPRVREKIVSFVNECTTADLRYANKIAISHWIEHTQKPRSSSLMQFAVDKTNLETGLHHALQMQGEGAMFRKHYESLEESYEVWVEKGQLKGPRNF